MTTWRDARAKNVREILNLISKTALTETITNRDSLVKPGAFTKSTHSIANRRNAACVASVVRTLSPSCAPPSWLVSQLSCDDNIVCMLTTRTIIEDMEELMRRRFSNVASYCEPISSITINSWAVLESANVVWSMWSPCHRMSRECHLPTLSHTCWIFSFTFEISSCIW